MNSFEGARSVRAKEIIAVAKRPGRLGFRVGLAIITGTLIVALPCAAEQLTNDKLSLTVNAQDGSYELGGAWCPAGAQCSCCSTG